MTEKSTVTGISWGVTINEHEGVQPTKTTHNIDRMQTTENTRALTAQCTSYEPSRCGPPRRWIVTGLPKSWRVAMNFPIALVLGPDDRGPCMMIVWIAGNTVISSSFRAGATSWNDFADRTSSFMEGKSCRNSSHWTFSMSSSQYLRGLWISRHSSAGRGDKAEL